MPRHPLLTRQVLGIFDTVTEAGRPIKVRVSVDPQRLANRMGPKAQRSPLKRNRAIFNAIMVELLD